MKTQMPIALIILDGFGYSKNTSYNAIASAHTPHLTRWFNIYPHTLLKASGEAVGLPKNIAGNSEAGHLTIGAGRILPQTVTLINNAIDNGSFFLLNQLNKQLKKLKEKNGTLHIIGLLSNGNVHSNEKHLYAYLESAIKNGITNIVVHPFLDGRDTATQSASLYLKRLEKKIALYGHGIIGSIHGRFYAMDRDANWSRTKKTYTTLTSHPPLSMKKIDWRTVLKKNYAHNIYDEFIPPTLLNPAGIIKPHDGIIFYNFRPDRARQLTNAFVDHSFNAFKKKSLKLTFFITPVSYQKTTKTCFLFKQKPVKNSLKEILNNAHKKIFSIAETEKYAHISYFFSGYKENPFTHEKRILIPSLHTKNYIRNPAMSAPKITTHVIHSLTNNPADFYLINYANADMVGHSGNLSATIKAIECLDTQLNKLYNHIVKKMGGTLCITADHGKAENMFNKKTNTVNTAHTTNKVPFIMIANSYNKKKVQSLKQLSDIAPFILYLMHLPVPDQMMPSEDHSQNK